VAELVRRGQAQTDAGDYTTAVSTLTEALSRNPRAADSYFARGEAYVLLERYAHAIDDYTHALTLAPDFAVRDSSESIWLDPDDTCAYVNRGEARTAQGDRSGALEDYQRALDLVQHCGCQGDLVKLLRERIQKLQQ
jgi:tetratricopeptide (TPR) repeat protein